MKIAVIGAGAIGGLVAGYLKEAGEDIILIGKPDSVEAIKKDGLKITGVKGDFNIRLEVRERLCARPAFAVLATKTQDVEDALKDNLKFLKDSAIVTAQNGVQADAIAARFIPKENIISSIVMFGSTYLKPGHVVHNFQRSWILGRAFGRNNVRTLEVSRILGRAFLTELTEEITGMKYLKLFVNSNNCIPAILGQSMQEAFRDLEVCRLSIGIWREALGTVNQSGIKLVSLPDFPVERVTQLTSINPSEAAKIFSGIMTSLSQEPLWGSVLQSIRRKRASEIDYINGEFVRLAETHNSHAPLNKALVAMVHEVEKSGNFFAKEELLARTAGLYS